MPLAALAAPFLMKLAENGLGLLAGAIQSKGKEVIEDKLGVKIPEDPEQLTPELLYQLKTKEIDHEEFLINAQLAEKRLEVEAEKHGQKQVTERWKFDMASDSWLSKNIRPLALAAVLFTIFIIVLAGMFGVTFQEAILTLVSTIASIIVGAYFLGRSTEKGLNIWRKK